MGIDHAGEDIRRACDLACLTPIAERGGILSGGQKQRLALARGILAARSSSALMLDEPTSSLDPATEARVYASLIAEFPDACIISSIHSSVHRPHLLPRLDKLA
jgi:ATP-binding cassette, subfamily B, bacterial